MTCNRCGGTGWFYDEAKEGVARCSCKRAAREPQPLSKAEMARLTIAAEQGADDLDAMPDYFAKTGRTVIAEALVKMCSTAEQVQWVVGRAVELFRSWRECGVPGLRQVLVSRYRSRDGIESGPQAISEAYPEGLPSRIDNLTGYQAAKLELPSAGEATEDRKLADSVRGLAILKRLPGGAA